MSTLHFLPQVLLNYLRLPICRGKDAYARDTSNQELLRFASQEHKSTSHVIRTLIDAYFYHLSTMSAGESEQSIVNKESAGALLLLPGGAGAGGDTCSVSEQVYIDSGNEKKGIVPSLHRFEESSAQQ